MPAIPSPAKLRDAIRAGYDELSRERELRVEAYKESWGRFHRSGDERKRYLNLIARFRDVLIPHIVSYNPEHDIQTDYAELQGEAALIGMYLTRLGYEINRKATMRAALEDAFLGPKAILRMGLKAGHDIVLINGREYDRGQPYLRLVPFDDWVPDPSARCQQEVQWEFEYLRPSRRSMLESGLYNPAVVERMIGLADGGSMRGSRREDRLDEQGRVGSASEIFEFGDQVEVIDGVLYDENGEHLRVTLTAEPVNFADDFLRIEPWEGPENGPFKWLEFKPSNGQLHGTPPVAAVREQAEAFYKITDKMIEDIEETKRLLCVDDSVTDDEIDQILEAANGNIVRVKNVAGMVPVEFGGTSDIYTAAIAIVYNWFNVASGNVDILSGAAPETDKATIYQGLQANANAIVEDYQEIHHDVENDVSKDLAFWGLSDPFMRLPMTHRMPGGELIQVHFNASQRRGDYEAFRYHIVHRSTMRQDPQVKMANVMRLLEIVLQAATVDAQTGYIDVSGVARLGGRLMDIREMQQIVRDQILNMELAQRAMLTPPHTQGQPMGPAGRGLPQGPGGPRALPPGRQSGAVPRTGMGATRSAATQGVPQGARR